MKKINNYIIEKLHLNKDIDVNNYIYVLMYRKSDRWILSKHNTLESVADFIRHNYRKFGAHDIYKCPIDIVNDFGNEYKLRKKELNNFDELKKLNEYIKEHKIYKISSDEINKCLSRTR